MLENRKFLGTDDLDGFDKRKLPSPGFQVEIVLADCDRSIQTTKETTISSTSDSGGGGGTAPLPSAAPLSVAVTEAADGGGATEKDMFSDNEVEETWQNRGRDELTAKVESLSLQNKSLPTSDEGGDTSSTLDLPNPTTVSEFKAMAADASVFTFGDEEDDDYESD